jgi:hypothetical protein
MMKMKGSDEAGLAKKPLCIGLDAQMSFEEY